MCPRQNYLDPGDRNTDPQEVEGVDAMGRGRQKAKHMKVARSLKYYSPETDLDALQRELTMSGDQTSGADEESDPKDDDEWAEDPWDTPSSSYAGAWEEYEDKD